MADGRQRRADPGAFVRTKPVIYNTSDGLTIVEDELLNFLLIKSRTLDQDNIIKLVKSSFSQQRIEDSKAVMAELFPDSKRWSSHRGEKKDELYIKMCLAVFKENVELPRFVSHYIDELPPVSFKHVDVSALLGRIMQLNGDIELLRMSITSQATACEKLLEISDSLTQRLAAVETPKINGVVSSGSADFPTAGQPAVSTPRWPDFEDPRSNGAPQPSRPVAQTETGMPEDSFQMAKTPQRERPTRGTSPALLASAREGDTAQETAKKNSWSTVVKRGRKRSAKTHEGKQRNTRKMTGITGTAVINNDDLSTVGTKMVSVFATKFNANLEADTLRLFLQEQMKREVKCRKIHIPNSRFSSFCVTAEWNEWKEMYNPVFWPAGSVIRRYFEPRRAKGASGADSPKSTGAQCPAAREGPLVPSTAETKGPAGSDKRA